MHFMALTWVNGWKARHHFRATVIVGDCTDLCVHQMAHALETLCQRAQFKNACDCAGERCTDL